MILELVSFRLQPGISQEHFLSAVADVDEFLAGRPGYLGRQVYRSGDGTWLDLVRWHDLPSAQAAAQAIRADRRCDAFLGCIAESSTTMTHAGLVHGHGHAPDQAIP
jgi:hypothetical protein